MSELKPCPFCGEDAVVKVERPDFQILGCSVLSMLCPNPSMTVYKKDGEFDYSWWNKRHQPVDEYRAICEPALGEMSLVINDDEYHHTDIQYTFKKLIKDLDNLDGIKDQS